MRNIFRMLTISFLLALTSCVASLHPLYTDQDLIFDSSLLGTWTDADSKETWTFSRGGEKEYRLVYTDEDGKTGEFTARLLSAAGERFLNLTPANPLLAQNDYFKGHFLPTHTFVKISQVSGANQFSYLEPKWLKTYLDKNPTAIRHQTVSGEIILTASPREMQNFLLRHLNTEGAFAKPISIKRKEGER